MENVGWQIARAARHRGTIYETDFDGTERVRIAETPVQSDAEMLAEATKIEAAWPHKVPPKRTTNHTKGESS